MLPQVLQSTTIPALAEVVNFTQARHEVLAGNIANANTPGYRTRDLSVSTFQSRLQEMIAANNARPSSPRSIDSPGYVSPGEVSADQSDALRNVRESLTSILQHDDTNIDLEKQAAEVSKNQMLHGIALTIMTNQVQLINTAISERV